MEIGYEGPPLDLKSTYLWLNAAKVLGEITQVGKMVLFTFLGMEPPAVVSPSKEI